MNKDAIRKTFNYCKLRNTISFLVIFLFPIILLSQKSIGNTSIGELHSHDTLTYKRGFLNTRIYQGGNLLTNKNIRKLYQDTWQPKVKFRWANYQRPLAPIITLGGVYLVYDGIKGIPMEATIEGNKYPYTKRSLPKVVGGLGAFVLGICMIESSNELIQHSVEIYNAHLKAKKKSTAIQNINFGISTSAQLGFSFTIK